MHMSAASSRWLREALRISEAPSRFLVPLYLCPRIISPPGPSPARCPCRRRYLSTVLALPAPKGDSSTPPPVTLETTDGKENEQEKTAVVAAAAAAPEASAAAPDASAAAAEASAEEEEAEEATEEEAAAKAKAKSKSKSAAAAWRRLPLQCSGCGAFSHTSDPSTAGYYDTARRAVREYLRPPPPKAKSPSELREDEVARDLLKNMSSEELQALGLDPGLLEGEAPNASSAAPPPPRSRAAPLCDRCHTLTHHQTGASVFHPTVESLRDTIAESPHKHNHIYHIIDAADFPMSLVPRLHETIGEVSLRTKNRRSRAGRFYHDTKIDMSFVITRSDLLAPTKAQVDGLMAYLRECLRAALGRFGQTIRLGNLTCVSAKRSWWTRELKERIWDRGGAAWMVGKVNVGKSQLFEAVFPKGRVDAGGIIKTGPMSVEVFPRHDGPDARHPSEMVTELEEEEKKEEEIEEEPELDVDSLLPPLQPVTNYPAMPMVSSLPGTTASPIRIPFGNSRGELIDLPGLARSDLELYVREEHRSSLVMRSRIVPDQQTVRPGQSLVLGGGLIRITAATPDTVLLTYAFTPIEPHVTSTEKAIGLQEQARSANVGSIATPEAGQCTGCAGTFELCHDVTKLRSGPITRPDFLAMKVKDLPWRVFSLDILIEGVGWVEVVAQMRAKDLYRHGGGAAEKPGSGEERSDGLGGLGATAKADDGGDEEQVDGPFARMARSADPAKDRRNRPRAETTRRPEYGPPPHPNYPAVHVFSPHGRFISSRPPINGWLMNKSLVLAKHKRARPRKSMKGHKKLAKQRRRAAAAATASRDRVA